MCPAPLNKRSDRIVPTQRDYGRRRTSASYVFRTSMARVIGPAPPGLGVPHPAPSSTPGAGSPPWPPSPRFALTSTTAAPGLPMYLVMRLGLPAAATRMSARFVWPARFLVLVWQMVTVAFRFNSSNAVGLPTMLLRPTTTALAPSIRTPARSSSSTIPLGVHG